MPNSTPSLVPKTYCSRSRQAAPDDWPGRYSAQRLRRVSRDTQQVSAVVSLCASNTSPSCAGATPAVRASVPLAMQPAVVINLSRMNRVPLWMPQLHMTVEAGCSWLAVRSGEQADRLFRSSHRHRAACEIGATFHQSADRRVALRQCTRPGARVKWCCRRAHLNACEPAQGHTGYTSSICSSAEARWHHHRRRAQALSAPRAMATACVAVRILRPPWRCCALRASCATRSRLRDHLALRWNSCSRISLRRTACRPNRMDIITQRRTCCKRRWMALRYALTSFGSASTSSRSPPTRMTRNAGGNCANISTRQKMRHQHQDDVSVPISRVANSSRKQRRVAPCLPASASLPSATSRRQHPLQRFHADPRRTRC